MVSLDKTSNEWNVYNWTEGHVWSGYWTVINPLFTELKCPIVQKSQKTLTYIALKKKKK